MKHTGSAFIFLYLFVQSHALWTQELEIRTYTTLDGLSDNLITCFYQDQFGYFWIGTVHGLQRFDGIKFQSFGVQNGMPSLWCNQLLEDKTGKLWAATRNGIAEFRKDSFYVYPTTNHVQPSYVFQLYKNGQDQLIANTKEGQFSFSGNKWAPYYGLNLQNKEPVTQVVKTNEGEFFITPSELFYKNNRGDIKLLDHHFGKFPHFINIQCYDNQVYVHAASTIYRVDSFQQQEIFPAELKDKTILNYFKDSQDRWWFSTKEDGILLVQQNTSLASALKVKVTYRNLSVLGYFEDNEKQIWAASSNGLIKILSPPFTNLKIKEVTEGQHIINVIPYLKNQLFISISEGKLLLIQYDIETTPSYKVLESYTLDLPNDFVDYHTINSSGNIWMVTRRNQLLFFETGKLENKTQLIAATGQPFVAEIAYYPYADSVVIALDSFLAYGDENKLDTLFDSYHNYIQFPRQVMFIDSHTLIIATLKGEVFLFARDENNKYQFSKTHSSSKWGRHITKDRNEKLWIYNVGENITSYKFGGSAGFQLADSIDEVNDNINTLFYRFTVDANGSIWSITNRGIQHIYKNRFHQWDSKDYANYEISHAVHLDWFKIVESENKIWVNLGNQLIYVDRNIPEHAEKSGTVVLEDIQLQNQTTSWNKYTDSLYSYFQTPSNLQLKHHENTLTFFYNSPTTIEAQGTMYSYRLLPGDTMWSKPSENKSVSFSKLHPANYTFEVRSRNRGMEWGDITSFDFVIQKPFWDTVSFRILVVLLLSGLIVWAFRIRIKQERAKGETKRQLLELEMRALRAQMNPHFIYNALNSIQSLVATNQTSSANKYISKFARLLRQVLESSKRSEITLSKEMEALGLYVDLEKLRLDDNVAFNVHIEEDINPDMIVIPPLILQPFVENSLWHGLSAKAGEKRIEIIVSGDPTWVHFSITDNGIGRESASNFKSPLKEHESTAMENIEQRLRDFNRTPNVNPLQVEDLFTPAGSAAGTRILLQIRKKATTATAVQ